jgi:hypothetical protein
MNWGKSIIVAFVLFAAFIGTLVTVCIRQDISLVSKDYYKEELEFEQQMIRMKNVSLLNSKPTIKVLENGSIQIAFDHFAEVEKGELKLFRPSDSAMDQKFDLTPTSSLTQIFSTRSLEPGMYRAKMQWTMRGKEFFLEEIVYI